MNEVRNDKVDDVYWSNMILSHLQENSGKSKKAVGNTEVQKYQSIFFVLL